MVRKIYFKKIDIKLLPEIIFIQILDKYEEWLRLNLNFNEYLILLFFLSFLQFDQPQPIQLFFRWFS